MLSLAEYKAQSAELHQLGLRYENEITDAVKNTTKLQALKATNKILKSYQSDYEKLLERSLLETADNASSYYAAKLGIDLPEKFNEKLVKKQYTQRYFGLTLGVRLAFNFRKLQQKAQKSAAVKPEHLGNLFTSSFPFGAHYNVDRRLLQAQSVKLEQDIAKEIATIDGLQLLRWKLSPYHTGNDICDELAGNIDKSVVNYLERNKLGLDPKGLYFVDKLPNLPHPNCQCEFGMVKSARDIPTSRANRVLSKVQSIIARIRSR